MLRTLISAGGLWAVMAGISHAQILTQDLELKTVAATASWQTVALENTYTEAVPVCTYALPSAASPPAVTRIRNVTSSSFDIRLQQFENSSNVTPANAYCVISDIGAHNTGGLKYEAHKVLSTGTSGLAVGWSAATTEEVTNDVIQSYANPHIVGQVMSFNDVNASVFWNFNCATRGNGAFFSGPGDRACVGKHIGQINGTRAAETLGFFIIEAGSGTVNDISFAAAVGPDTGGGVGNNPPYSYSVSGDFDTGVLTDAGEDGGHGGWAVLFGADPFPAGNIRWAIDEEVVAGDTTRTHTTENVGYWVFDNNQTPNLSANKTLEVYSGSASDYSIPGSEVIYTITANNAGSGPVDGNSIFLVDSLPPEISFYNGDMDDGGPVTGPVLFTDIDSGLTFGIADVGYSTAAAAPTNFSQCNASPGAGYQNTVRHICFAPKGTFSEGTITPASFSVSFRAQIK
jgi:uncharacterized repeat protein (TIGR01451 family)